MTSQAQIAANRRNALKSTGPNTPAGKAVTSQNAVKHGLLAQRSLVPGECQKEFEQFKETVIAEVRPDNIRRAYCTERLVHLLWRLRRVAGFEASMMEWLAYAQVQREGEELSTREATAQDRQSLNVGRWIEAMLEEDRFQKLCRYEAHLSREVERLWKEIG